MSRWNDVNFDSITTLLEGVKCSVSVCKRRSQRQCQFRWTSAGKTDYIFRSCRIQYSSSTLSAAQAIAVGGNAGRKVAPAAGQVNSDKTKRRGGGKRQQQKNDATVNDGKTLNTGRYSGTAGHWALVLRRLLRIVVRKSSLFITRNATVLHARVRTCMLFVSLIILRPAYVVGCSMIPTIRARHGPIQ